MEIASKAKMLTFVLPTKKRLVVSSWTFLLNISATIANWKKSKPPKIHVDARLFF